MPLFRVETKTTLHPAVSESYRQHAFEPTGRADAFFAARLARPAAARVDVAADFGIGVADEAFGERENAVGEVEA